MNLPALIDQAVVPSGDNSDLLDIYRGWAMRSKKEAKLVTKLLAKESGNYLDTDALFSMPEAWNEKGEPSVAIAPIHVKKIRFMCLSYDDESFFHPDGTSRLREYSILDVPNPQNKYTYGGLIADLPPIPKKVLPWNPLAKKSLYVLWDANWKRAIPVDPYLLKRVSNTQFEVVDHWDLSEKERELLALLNKFYS